MAREVFSEQQVSAILRRAVELSEKQNEEGYTPGITKDELIRIAQEVGLSPEHLEQAIREAGSNPEFRKKFNLVEEFEEVVDGEIPPENFDVLTPNLRTFGRGSGIRQIGRSLQGRVWTGGGTGSLTVTSRNGRTRIEGKSNPLGAVLLSLYPAFIGMVISAGVLGDNHLASYIPVAIAGFGAAGVAGFFAMVRKGQEGMRKLVRDLRGVVEEETKAAESVPPNAIAPQEDEVRQNLGGPST